MDVIAGNLPRDNLKLMLQGNLPKYVSCPNRHLTRQYPFSVFRDPYQVNFQIRLSMAPKFVKSHNATTITFSSPEGEGFPPSPRETLTGPHRDACHHLLAVSDSGQRGNEPE